MLPLIHVDENGNQHEVRIEYFPKHEPTQAKINGRVTLNPANGNYPDKKWVERNTLFTKDGDKLTPAVFSEHFVENNTI